MRRSNHIETVIADKAPQAIGPYSQAVMLGGLVFCSGQIPLNPNTGEMVQGDVGKQTHQVIANMRSILEAANTDLDHVVKTTVFLTNIQHFSEMNKIYGEYFTKVRPARSTVQVAALPGGAMVEIEAIAVVPKK